MQQVELLRRELVSIGAGVHAVPVRGVEIQTQAKAVLDYILDLITSHEPCDTINPASLFEQDTPVIRLPKVVVEDILEGHA